eukprot:ANDGO_00311.mRNA.1 hypothetical protein DICPUDRAFT_56279
MGAGELQQKGAVLSFLAKYVTFVQHNAREIRRRKVGYCLGFLSVFIVVLVVSASVTTLDNVPIIFFSLAENERGQIDMVMTPSGSTTASALKYPLVNSLLATMGSKAGDYTYSSPRIDLSGVQMYSDAICPGFNYSNVANRYVNGSALFCGTRPFVSGDFLAMDTARESRAGVGRKYNLPSVPAGSVYLMTAIANDLKVVPGDYVYVLINLYDVFSDVWLGNSFQYVIARFQVARIIDSNYYKTTNTRTKIAFAEIDPLAPFLATQMDPGMPGSAIEKMANSTSADFSNEILFNLPSPRISYYNYNNYDKIQYGVSRWGAVALYRVGFNQISSRMPLLYSMRATRFLSLFLGLIIFMVVAILAVLSIILIYSLLMVSVETRTFELGLLRMIGMKRSDLIQLIMIHALMYAIPAWAIGLALGQVLAWQISLFLSDALGVQISPLLTPLGIGIATLLGFAIPLFASIFPIRSALTMNLHDSLDTRHSKTKAVVYKLERSETGRLSPAAMVVGLLLVIFGAFVYYYFPYALLALKIDLLIYMFFFLLLALLFGLVLLSMNLETIAERLVTFFFLFWETHAINNMIHKNLSAHRTRNRKTSIMYALSLAFIIFLLVSLELQIMSFQYASLQRNGGQITITTSVKGGLNNIDFLRKLESADLGTSYAYIFVASNSGFTLDKTQLETIGRYAVSPIRLSAASPNLYDVSIDGFLKISRQNDTSGLSIMEQLYTSRGGRTCLLGSSFEDLFKMSGRYYTPVQLHLERSTPRFPIIFQRFIRVNALVDVSPVFGLSKFTAGGENTAAAESVVSLPTLFEVGQFLHTYASYRQYPISRILFDTNGYSKAKLSSLKDRLNPLIEGFTGLSVGDVNDSLAAIVQGVGILQIFFSFTILIAMTMCFFSLTSSMFTNIYEQSKEIGVLRAIGTKRHFVIRLYVYEAFVLVVAASFLGIMIGVVVSYTMVIQRALFTQLPIPFVFPYLYMAVVVFFAVIFALLAAFSPARVLSLESIVATLRRINS